MTSLRRGLSLRLLAGLSCLFIGLAAGLYFLTRYLLTAQGDAALEEKARVLAGLVKINGAGHLDVDFAEEPMPEFERARAPEYFELWHASGRLIERSGSLRGGDLPRSPVPAGAPVAFALTLPDGRPGRALTFPFTPHIESERNGPAAGDDPRRPAPLLLIIARGRADLDAALVQITGALAAAGILLLLGAAAVVVTAVRRGLAPLAEVARQAETIDAGTLHAARFPVAEMPDELAAITRRLNDLLARLADSFERERRFSADVAHELRTPIAELRSLAEVALRWPGASTGAGGKPEGSDAGSYRDVLDVAVQMERVVSRLLALARCDAGSQEVTLEPVDLGAAVADAWKPLQDTAATRGIGAVFDLDLDFHLNLDLPATAALVQADRALLASILGNLFANAVEYTASGGRLTCSATREADSVVLCIANTTADLTAADLPHLFQPFWRKDAARSDRAHAGLGLALVSAFARLTKVDVRADLPAPDVFRMRLRFATAAARGA